MDDIHTQNDWLDVLPGLSPFCPLAPSSMLITVAQAHSTIFLLNMPAFWFLRLRHSWKPVLDTKSEIIYRIGQHSKSTRELGHNFIQLSHFTDSETQIYPSIHQFIYSLFKAILMTGTIE